MITSVFLYGQNYYMGKSLLRYNDVNYKITHYSFRATASNSSAPKQFQKIVL